MSATKKKSEWQLFTNDGKFDSKIPPAHRLNSASSYYKRVHFYVVKPRQKSAAPSIIDNQTSADSEPKIILPQVENVENFVIVWLHDQDTKRNEIEKSKAQLLNIGNCIKTFKSHKECHKFVSSIENEKIFLIVSGASAQSFIPVVHEADPLQSIYILCPDEPIDQTWISQYPAINGTFSNMGTLCQEMKKDVKILEWNLVGFQFIERSKKAMNSKENRQDALFMYDQLFRDIVLRVEENDMQDMYEFCKKEYRNNEKELQFLDKLTREYKSAPTIYWYTHESFLYRMMNKALRAHEYDTLYVLRVFIRDLHWEIAEGQKKNSPIGLTLFRGMGVEKRDFEQMKSCENGLLSVSSFFSTSTDPEIALKFARASLKDPKRTSILMEIKVDKNPVVPVCYISNISVFKDEKEWLFSIGAVFRVGKIKRNNEGIWVMQLTTTNDQDKQLTSLRQFLKNSMQDRNHCLNFANLMHQLANWRKCEFFYKKALQTETEKQRRSALFNNIAMVKEEMGREDEALSDYRKSLSLKDASSDNYISERATVYNNIGSLYFKQSKMNEAADYFEKALADCNTQPEKNQALMATLYGNIANIRNRQGKYLEALKKSEESLTIRQNIYPEIHPDIASGYSTMANVLYNLGRYSESITCAEKAVEIDNAALPLDHPQTKKHMQNLEVLKMSQSQS